MKALTIKLSKQMRIIDDERLTIPVLVLIIITLLIGLFTGVCNKDHNNIQPFNKTATFGVKRALTTKYAFSNPISYTNKSNFTINLDSINCKGGSENGITLTGCSNVTIKNCKLYNSTGDGIYLYNCINVYIDSCFITNVNKGVNASTSSNVVVNACQILNVNKGVQTGNPIQFNTVSGGSVTNNKIENDPGVSTPEDCISMYKSNGTAANPIMISGNEILGGGPSTTGGGINLGDGGASSYQICENNILVNPGQYGIAVSSGTNMQLLNNKVYAAKSAWSNVGVIVWQQYSPSLCSSVTVSGNLVNWTNKNGALNPGWSGGGCGTVAGGWNPNLTTPTITSSILPVNIVKLH